VSITRLRKLTVLGHVDDKATILSDLQSIGCLHLVSLTEKQGTRGADGPSGQAREALRFLLGTPSKRRQVKDPTTFDAERVERDVLALQGLLKDLGDERDFLAKRIADLKVWGDFDLGRLEDVAGQRLWFYLVPSYRLREIEAMDVRWALVNRDNRFCYVVVIAKDEPERMPVARTHTGPKPRHELERRLDEVELAIEDAIAERASLSRWCLLFAHSLDQLEEQAARAHAATWTLDEAPLFAIAGWAPIDAVARVQAYTTQKGLMLETEEPTPDDSPPTLFDNAPIVAGGQDLVTFYMTPGYWTWDPSAVVLYSFSLFFAMILADAGYAAILAVILWLSWGSMSASEGGRRFRTTFITLVAFSAVYGVIAGSYFGVELSTDNPLLAMKLLDITDAPTMMAVSIVIGVAHVTLANLMDAFRLGFKIAALPPLGWAVAAAAGLGRGHRRWVVARRRGRPGSANLGVRGSADADHRTRARVPVFGQRRRAVAPDRRSAGIDQRDQRIRRCDELSAPVRPRARHRIAGRRLQRHGGRHPRRDAGARPAGRHTGADHRTHHELCTRTHERGGSWSATQCD